MPVSTTYPSKSKPDRKDIHSANGLHLRWTHATAIPGVKLPVDPKHRRAIPWQSSSDLHFGRSSATSSVSHIPEYRPPSFPVQEPTVTSDPATMPIYDHHMGPKPRAQQMQARALAAQAAHQQRVSTLSTLQFPQRGNSPQRLPSTQHRRNRTESEHEFQHLPFLRSHELVSHRPNNLALRVAETTPTQAVTYPSLNNPINISDPMDEAQVEHTLRMSLTPSPSSFVPFTSPTADVDISAFLPTSGPPVLVANESTIAASAVPISDWIAEMCWTLCNQSVSTAPSHSAVWSPDSAPKRASLLVEPALVSFKSFVRQTLSATLCSPPGVILGLHFLSRLPLGKDWQSASSTVDTPSSPFHSAPTMGRETLERDFRQIIFAPLDSNTSDYSSSLRLIFTLALMLSNKWLEDNTFTTRTW